MAKIRLVTERHLSDLRTRVSVTEKTSPSRAEAEAELAEAEKHAKARAEVTAAATKLGLKVNSYAGTCAKTGVEVKPACGFVEKVNGKWITYAFAVVQERVGHQGV